MRKRRRKTSLVLVMLTAFSMSSLAVLAQQKSYDQYIEASRNAKDTSDLKTADQLCDSAIKAASTVFEKYESLYLKGDIAYLMSEFESAKEFYLKAIDMLATSDKPAHPAHFAYVYEDLGQTYYKLSELNKCEEAYQKAIDYLKKCKEPQDTHLGHVYFLKTQVTCSETDALEAIRLLKNGKTVSDKEALISANVQLADLKMRRGEAGEAEEIYKQAVEDRTKLLGTINHKNNAYMLTRLGTMCLEQDRFAEAEEYFKRALTIAETVRGPVHQQVAKIDNMLASMYSEQSRYEEAEKYGLKALSIMQKLSAPDSADVAVLNLNIDEYRSKLGKKTRPDAEIEHFVEIITKTYGNNSQSTVDALSRLANIYDDHDITKARQVVAQALKIAEGNKYLSTTPLITKSARLALKDEDYIAAKTFLDRLLVSAGLNNLSKDEAEKKYANLFADYYKDTKQYEKAEKLYKSALYTTQQKYGEGHPAAAIALNNIAMLYQSQGKHSEALKMMQQSLAIDKATYGLSNPNTLKKMANIADVYAVAGDYKSAEPLAKTALEQLSKLYPNSHSDVKYVREILDSLYDKNHNLRASKPLTADSPHLAVQTNTSSKPEVGAANMQKGHAAESKAPAEDIFSPHIPKYVKGILEYGLKEKRIDSTLKLVDAHFKILETKVGKTDTVIADHLMEIAQMIAEHPISKKYREKAYSIWLSIQPRLCVADNKIDYQITQMSSREGGLNTLRLKAATNLIQAAQAKLQQGDTQTYGICVKGAQKCLEFADAPEDRSKRVALLLDLSKLTRLQTDFAYARLAADLALKVAQQDSKAVNEKRDSLLELARITLAQRDYASCARFAGQAVETFGAVSSSTTKVAPGTKISKTEVEALILLCTCSSELGKSEEAIKYGTRATAALEGSDAFNESMIELIEALVDLHTKKKDYTQSVMFVDNGLEYCRKFAKTDTITYADLLWSKSRLKKALKAEQESKKLMEEASVIYRANAQSKDLVAAIHCNNQLAIFEDKSGNGKAAAEAALTAANKVTEYVRVIFPQLSFGEQCAFLQNTIRPQIGYLIDYSSFELEDRKKTYSQLIQWKGLLISSLRKQTVVINSDSNPEVAKLISALDELRTQLAAWHLRMSDRSLTPEQWTAKNDELTVQKEALERELSQQTKQAGYFDHAAAIDADEFEVMLAKDELFIDFYRYVKPGVDIITDDSNSDQSKPRYAAYVVTSEFYPKATTIGTAEEVDKAIKEWRSDVLDNASDTKSRAALTSLVWTKIAKVAFSEFRTKNKAYVEPKRIFVCPDAEIARVPWSTFFVQNTKGEPFLTTVFDSPREFVNAHLNRLLSKGNTQRMMLVGNVDFKGTDIESLTATEKEIQDISEVAKKASIATDILTQKNATKAAVLAKLPGESIVHLATHGYFASTQNLPTAWRESLGAVSLVRSAQVPMITYATRNLLLSSGLLLAPPAPVLAQLPSNAVSTNATSSVRQADRLSAEELIGLDLSKCHLITLSACETGRGEEVTGQGVMGLRSAMMAAGARSILMSLWKVPDDATQKLMTYFYTNMLIKKLPKAEALKLAQESVRDDPSGKYKHPWFWAAWVLAGEGW